MCSLNFLSKKLVDLTGKFKIKCKYQARFVSPIFRDKLLIPQLFINVFFEPVLYKISFIL